MSSDKVAVVTGAAGFIGSHMVDRLLEEGYRVRAVDNLSSGGWENLESHRREPRLTTIELDLRRACSEETLFLGAEHIFHFAGIADIVPSIQQPAEYMSTNVMATVHCLEAARSAGVRKFVYAASSSCYGVATELPTKEGAEISPQYPYALSKHLGEQAVMHWGRVYRMPVVSLRIFNAYGPRSRTTGAYGAVFGVFLAQKAADKPFTVVGDGTQTRDFVFVTDLARAFLHAAESDRANEVYNVGAGNPQSVNRLVELLGGDVVHVPKRLGEPDCTWAGISKIKRDLAWEPRVSFEDGVRLMLDNIDGWRDAPVWDADSAAAATRDWFKYLAEVAETEAVI